MILRATGVKEVLIILVSMVIGAVFIVFAFQFGTKARPEEMRVWGSTEAASISSPPSGSSASASSSGSASTGVAAPSAAAVPAPAGSAEGKAVFDKNCNACHPGGSSGVGPALNSAAFKQRYPQDSDMADVIRKGKGGMMPAFSATQIGDNDLKNLVSYIRSLK